MKKIFLTFGIALTVTLLAFSQEEGVKWLTIQQAQELNKKEPRKFFIDVYTDWCVWCKKMDQTTYKNPVIAKILNTKYYPVKFNAESKEPVEFAGHKFEYQPTGNGRGAHQLAIALLQGKLAFPSVAYLDEKLQLLTVVPGYFTPEGLEPILQYFATNAYKTTSWQDYQKSFVSEIKK